MSANEHTPASEQSSNTAASDFGADVGKALYLVAGLCLLSPVLMFAAALMDAGGRGHELAWRAIALFPTALFSAPWFAGAGIFLGAGRRYRPKARLALQLIGCVLALAGGTILINFLRR